MGRLARVVAADVPHHLTQRGNARRFVLDSDADRSVYLNLLRENVALYRVSLIGYCLMSNHIHLIAVPRTADGLAQALKHVHGRYASYWNAAHQSNGHLWQGRYYSCPLDEPHLWEALRYTELNPLRAGPRPSDGTTGVFIASLGDGSSYGSVRDIDYKDGRLIIIPASLKGRTG
jgi:putative transposase